MRYVVMAAILLLVGCSQNTAQISIANVCYDSWQKDDVVLVSIYNNDTISKRRLSLALRYDARLKQTPIKLLLESSSITKYHAQTLNIDIPLIDNRGIFEFVFPIRESVVLSDKGLYKFRLSPLNRSITGIYDIAIIVE